MDINNKFIYFTGDMLERTRAGNFKITFEEEEITVCVSLTDVNRIKNKVDETEELIALVLGYIEYIYQITKVSSQRMERLEIEVIVDNVIVILSHLPAEEMIDIIRTLKWHEIFQIFESVNPVQEIRNFQ